MTADAGQAAFDRKDAARDKREREAIDAQSAPKPAPHRLRGVCGDCAAFDCLPWASAVRGYCKARPPVVAATDGGVETVFPIMAASGWCLGYRAA